MRLIDADHLLNEIEALKKSPWFNNGSNSPDPLVRGRHLAINETVGMVVDLCIKQEPTVEPKKRESRAKLPCPCGRKRLDLMIGVKGDGTLTHYVCCPVCNREAGGKTYIAAVRAWNKMVMEEKENARVPV